MVRKKRKKRIKIIIILLVIISLGIVLGVGAYFIVNLNSSGGGGTSGRGGGGSGSGSGYNRCNDVVDTFEDPDYERVRALLQGEQMVKDIPKSGSIKIRFFHDVDGCRFNDAHILLTKDSAELKNAQADILVWVYSTYADQIQAGNLCEVFQQAKNDGNLGQSSELSKTKLLFRYKGMLKYKDCFGLDI